jgi:hypothetical protein
LAASNPKTCSTTEAIARHDGMMELLQKTRLEFIDLYWIARKF